MILALTGALARLDAPAEINLDLRVSVVDADVTAFEASEAMRSAKRASAPIQLVVGDQSLPIEAATLRDWVSFQKTPEGDYRAVVDTTPLTGVVDALAKQIDREPVNAEFVTTSGLVTDILPSKDGYKLDVPATVAEIRQFLDDRIGG